MKEPSSFLVSKADQMMFSINTVFNEQKLIRERASAIQEAIPQGGHLPVAEGQLLQWHLEVQGGRRVILDGRWVEEDNVY